MDCAVLWDRLAGEIVVYVENYILFKTGGANFRLNPSYPVDYEIENVEEIVSDKSVDGYFAHKISGCRDVNELPTHLKKLVMQYLPRFLANHPEYSNEECLTIK